MPCGPVLSAHNLLRTGLAALLALICAASADAQPAPVSPPDHAAATATPSLTSEVLPLDFVVRTKSGKPVLNLKSSDLLLTDNGSAVALNDLRLVKGTEAPDRLVTLVFDSLDVVPAQQARSLAAKILAQFPQTGYTYAVMQIAGGTPFQSSTILPPSPSVRQISSPDAADLPPQTAMTTSSGLRLLQNFTTSQDLLRKAIELATRETAAQSPPNATPAEEQLAAFARRNPGAAQAEDLDRAESLLSAMNNSRQASDDGSPSLAALIALVRSQRRIAGRKIILYFSQGLPADNDSLNMVGSLVAEANRSEVSIVTVNLLPGVTLDTKPTRENNSTSYAIQLASGTVPGRTRESAWEAHRLAGNELTTPLSASGVPDMMNLGFSSGPVPGSGAANAPDLLSDPQPLDPLAVLSAATGGVSFTGDGIKKPLRQLRDDLTDYYEALYTPKLTSFDGEFHPLTVRAPHRRLLIRSRAGYFALPPDSASGMRLYEVPLLAILTSPRLPTEFTYHAQVLHLGDLAGRNTAELVLEVPLSQLQVRADADTNLSSAHVAVVMQVRNAKGEVLSRFSEDTMRRGRASAAQFREVQDADDAGAAAFARDVIVMERPFTAEPGDYTLETAVLDEFGNKAAAQRTTFTIPPIAPPQQPQPLLSDLTVVRRIDPLHQEGRQFDPMRYKTGQIIPNLSGVLPEDTDHVSFFVLIHAAGATQPRITLRILRDGHYVCEIPLTLASPVERAANQTALQADVFPWLGTIQTSAFPPGHYEVQATLSQNGQTSTSATSFVVEGKRSASSNVAFTAVSGEADPDRALPGERQLTESAALGSSGFSLSSPANPLPPPTPAQLEAMVEAARQRALAWTDSLPNFLCVETTWHSLYARSSRSWQPSDTAVQRMRYIDHAEDRTLVELNGRRHGLPLQVEFAHSTGEFGGALRGIFEPEAHAQFTWKRTDLLNGEPVQVIAYSIPRATSTFNATNQLHDAFVAFHGLVWIDAATHNIRRVTETLDDVPRNVGIRAASISIDYAWVSIDRHEYMLPVHGAMSVLRGRHHAELNQFAFTNYQRFGSQVRMLPWDPAEAKLAH